jgi:hypothetical protein
MKLFFENWRKHLSENKTQVLREATEEELEWIRKAIYEMKPTDLAFNHLFGDKMRRIIDFDTIDKDTGLGKLVTLWPDGDALYDFGGFGYNDFKWVPDFETGTVSRLNPNDYRRKAGLEKDVVRDKAPTPEELQRFLFDPTNKEKEKPKEEDIRKETMKIGKFLKKGERLAARREELAMEIEKVSNELQQAGYGSGSTELGEKRNALYNKLGDAKIELDRHMSHSAPPLFSKNWQELGRFWQENAAFLKENPHGATSDTYKIIVTRHPIDIFRMSDFDKITSCHRPPSHPGYQGPQNNYIQCAVAEAHGEGAVAYVVQKDALFEETGTETIEEAEKAINASEEIFFDKRRADDWADEDSIGIIPNSRVRLRKTTYFQPDEWLNAFNLRDDSSEGTQFAVPEVRDYPRFTGLVDKMQEWAVENQKEQIKHFPKDEKGNVRLGRFIKSGGTYDDHNTLHLMKQMLPGGKFIGNPVVDDTVEKGLDLDLGRINIEAIEREVKNVDSTYGSSTLSIVGEAYIDDYGENYWIKPEVFMKVSWPESEFKSLDHSLGEDVLSDLDDMGLMWVNQDGRAPFTRVGDDLVMHIPLDARHIFEGDKEEREKAWRERGNRGRPPVHPLELSDISEYEHFASLARSIANNFNDLVKDQANRFARREGMMHGGVFTNWGWDIINEDNDGTYYDWQATAQEGDDVDIESIEIETQVTMDADDWSALNAPGMTPEHLAKIMNTGEFRILLSKALFKPIFEANPDREKYYSSRKITAEAGEKMASVRITFDVYDESNDEQVQNLKDVIEHWDDEDAQMDVVLRAVAKLIGADRDPEPQEENEGGLGSLKEHFKRFL